MATTKEYKELFILEQLDLLDNVTCRSMMGRIYSKNNDLDIGYIKNTVFIYI